MAEYKVWLKSVNENTDLKRTSLAISRIKKISQSEAIELLKNLPQCIVSRCKESSADKIFKGFRAFQAEVMLEEISNGPIIKDEYSNQAAGSAGNKGIKVVLLTMVLSTAIFIWGGYMILSKVRPTQKQATKLLNQGDYKRAERAFRKEIKNNPNSVRPYLQRAIALLSQAKQELKKEGWNTYGDANALDQWQDPRLNEALATLEAAAKRFPQEAEIFRWRGVIYEEKSLFAKAEDNYDTAHRLRPNDLVYLNLMGNLNVNMELYQKADYNFRKALQINPNHANTLKNLMILHLYHIKDFDKALEYHKSILEKPIKADYDLFAISKDAAEIFWKNTNPQSVIQDFDLYDFKRKSLARKIKENPTWSVLQEMGILFHQKGIEEPAIENLKKSFKIHESDNTLNWLAKAYMKADNMEMAYRTWEKIHKINPRNLTALKNLSAFTFLYRRDLDKASKYLRSYLEAGGREDKEQLIEWIAL